MTIIEKSPKKAAKPVRPVAAAPAALDPSRMVPLTQLVLSTRYNVRQQGGDRVDELAALIDAQGLLQALLVIEEVDGEGPTGRYEVIAGGRRWRALNLLAERGKLARDALIECKLKEAAQAVEVSLAENSAREAMHPADEFAAFQRLVEEGQGIETIAARFGVSALTVQRRLKLANVSPVLMTLFRAGGIALEQLMALAITDDHALQESVWHHASTWERDPRQLRRLVTVHEVDAERDPLARFVGIAAYEAAGGIVRRDLFSECAQGTYLCDVPLLRTLAYDQLHRLAASLKEQEGWSWVEVRESFSYADSSRFGKVKASARAPTATEAATLAALRGEWDTLRARLDDDEDTGEDVDVDALERTQDAIEDQIAHIEDGLLTWPDEVKAASGAVITLNHQGEVEIRRGLVLPDDAAVLASDDDAANLLNTGATPKAKPAVSEALMRKLSSHRTAALQAMLMARPEVAMVALAQALVVSTFPCRGSAAIHVRATPCRQALKTHADDMAVSRAWLAVEAQLQAWEARLPEERSELFGWLQALPAPELAALMALCTAAALDATSTQSTAQPASDLAAALGLDMADWWRPTGSAYFAQVPKDKVIEAVAEACGSAATVGFDKMKKGDLIQAAEQCMATTRWLPMPLRRA